MRLSAVWPYFFLLHVARQIQQVSWPSLSFNLRHDKLMNPDYKVQP
jgi:hypothetical protein